jgi:hypothetical protein
MATSGQDAAMRTPRWGRSHRRDDDLGITVVTGLGATRPAPSAPRAAASKLPATGLQITAQAVPFEPD